MEFDIADMFPVSNSELSSETPKHKCAGGNQL